MSDAKQYWNDRAKLKAKAGTNDLIAKQLEMDAIIERMKDGIDVLDFGCGNGITAIEIAKRFKVNLIGIDYSEDMIKEANENLLLENQSTLKGKVTFLNGSMGELFEFLEHGKFFDIIYTERMIINIKDWEEQKQMIRMLCSLLKQNGKYLMVENFMDGLDNINGAREILDLKKIVPPWHNRYMQKLELPEIVEEGLYDISEIINYSSDYYFLSRIVNAYTASQTGEEPAYESFINQLALLLPLCCTDGSFAQGSMVIWIKKDKNM